MLDAAHGETVRTVGVVQRVHAARVEEQTTRVVVARAVGRRRPGTALDADAAQGSRLTVAEARSRRSKQSLE